MIKRTLIIIYLFLITSICLSAQDQLTPQIEEQKSILANDSNNIEALKRISFALLHKGDYDKAIYYGTKLFNKGYSDQDYTNSVLYSHICLGQAYVMKGDVMNAYNNLKQAELIGRNTLITIELMRL